MGVNDLSGKERFGILLSVIWLGIAGVMSSDSYDGLKWSTFLLLGFFPPALIYCAIWTIKGFLKEQPDFKFQKLLSLKPLGSVSNVSSKIGNIFVWILSFSFAKYFTTNLIIPSASFFASHIIFRKLDRHKNISTHKKMLYHC